MHVTGVEGTTGMNLAQKISDCQHDYQTQFIQRQPKYAVKLPGRTWRTKNKSLADPAIQAHLDGTYAVAGLGQWYPQFAALDFDSVPFERVLSIREELGLNDSNSTIYNSESPDSHHIFFRPAYNDQPPTLKLLNDSLKGFCTSRGIEIYPQKSHAFRLPFGANQRPIFLDGGTLDTLEQKMYWFNKLDSFDLATVPRHQGQLDLILPGQITATKRPGIELLEHGLQSPGSRHYAQFEILYALWRENVPINEAVHIVWKWIQAKHNGFSQDILRHSHKVADEIKRQAASIYSRYDLAKTYPDTTHNVTSGYISKPDLQECIKASKGNMPRLKFMTELIRYCNPRRHRAAIQIHTDKLQNWSSKDTYLKRMVELEDSGIIDRSTGYQVGANAKAIKIKWPWRSSRDAILLDGRSADHRNSLKHCFTPEEFRDSLKAAGAERTAAIKASKDIFEGVKKQGT